MNRKKENMHALFNPKCVAVIGASDNERKLGFHVMKSLTAGGFKGKIIPVNPGTGEIMGLRTSHSVMESDADIDLGIVVVPAKAVPEVFRECADRKVKGIVLITAGFREIDDPGGAELHKEVAGIAERAGIPVIGPNTFGMINLKADLNASFTPQFSNVKKGDICLVSQSGGISHLLSFMAMRMDLGFSKIVGIGNRLNVDFAHMVEYLMDDPDTRVIVLYMEGIEDARFFFEVVKGLEKRKPVIAYKTGAGTVGDDASRSHTGALAGSHSIYTGAFTQAGILHIPETEALLDAAKAMVSSPLPEGPGVAVLSGQAGPSMAACDVCEFEGLVVSRFTQRTQEKVNECLPPLALRTNPVDMGPAWYDSQAIKETIRSVMDDPNVNGILILMMFASANVGAVEGISDLLEEWAQRKPVISCILAPPGIWDEKVAALEVNGFLVNYPTPERAARALGALWQYRKILG